MLHIQSLQLALVFKRWGLNNERQKTSYVEIWTVTKEEEISKYNSKWIGSSLNTWKELVISKCCWRVTARIEYETLALWLYIYIYIYICEGLFTWLVESRDILLFCCGYKEENEPEWLTRHFSWKKVYTNFKARNDHLQYTNNASPENTFNFYKTWVKVFVSRFKVISILPWYVWIWMAEQKTNSILLCSSFHRE